MAVEDKTLWSEVHACLRDESVQIVSEQDQVGDLSGFIHAIEHSHPDLVLIDVSVLRQTLQEVIEKLRLAAPGSMIVALTCPLTPETQGLIGAAALATLKPGALLVNVARGKVVDEAALLAALADGRVGAAALDCFHEEPLPRESPFWALPNLLITPHAAGETGCYENNVVDILNENIERLLRGETTLRNQVV